MWYFEVDDCDWWCDDCGDLLNDQDGFDFDCGTWKCKKCGCVNTIDVYHIKDNFESKFEVGDSVRVSYKEQSGVITGVHKDNHKFIYDVEFQHGRPSKPIEFFQPDEDDMIWETESLTYVDEDSLESE